MEAVIDFLFLGCKITVDDACSHEIKKTKTKPNHMILGRKAMTNIDSVLKSTDITLLTKLHVVKAIIFPVVTYSCEVDHKEC